MALSWWLIGILLIALVVTVFKTQDVMFIFSLVRKYFFVFLIIGSILFISFSFYHIYSKYDLDLTNSKGIANAGKLYFTWFLNIFKNIGKITGYAVNQDWVLNSTNASNVK